MKEKSTVVVFGGSGFLGSYLCDLLTSEGHSVTIADLKKSAHFDQSKQSFISCDIFLPEQVEKALSIKPDYVFNLAGVSDIDFAGAEPLKTMHLNVIGNIHILEACVRAKSVIRFAFASSAYAASIKGSYYGISKLTS